VLGTCSTGARLVFSADGIISSDGQDVYARGLKGKVLLGGFGKLVRAVDLTTGAACRRVFASASSGRVRGSEPFRRRRKQGPSVWSRL